MQLYIDPGIVPPVAILIGLGTLFLNIGIRTRHEGNRSRFTARQIALGLDRPSMMYNPRTRTIVCGTLPEPDDEGDE